ncbi:hypothetical protein DXG01_014830, partial [Tephrocybe rancida]
YLFVAAVFVAAAVIPQMQHLFVAFAAQQVFLLVVVFQHDKPVEVSFFGIQESEECSVAQDSAMVHPSPLVDV